VGSEIRAFMEAKGLDQTTLAKRVKVSQASVSRALKDSARKRRGKAYLRLCIYMQQQNRRRVFDRLDRERMHEAIDHIWDVSEAHADAVAKVVQEEPGHCDCCGRECRYCGGSDTCRECSGKGFIEWSRDRVYAMSGDRIRFLIEDQRKQVAA